MGAKGGMHGIKGRGVCVALDDIQTVCTHNVAIQIQ
jgi:hypothetical protein